jgi:hypothetical protein
MRLFTIAQHLDGKAATLQIAAHHAQLLSFFAWGEAAELDKRCLPFRVDANDYSDTLLNELDYFNASIGIPIVSKRFRDVLQDTTDDVDFVPCTALRGPEKRDVYAMRVKRRIDLIDKSASGFRKLTDGSSILQQPVYRSLDIPAFFVARDVNYAERLVASGLFVDVVVGHRLRLEVVPERQTPL